MNILTLSNSERILIIHVLGILKRETSSPLFSTEKVLRQLLPETLSEQHEPYACTLVFVSFWRGFVRTITSTDIMRAVVLICLEKRNIMKLDYDD